MKKVRATPETYCRKCGVTHRQYCHPSSEHRLSWWCDLCAAYHYTQRPGWCFVYEINNWGYNQGENVTDYEARKKVLQEQIDRAADELARLQKFEPLFGTDFESGTVLRWLVQQPLDNGHPAIYNYAFKRGDAWQYNGRQVNFGFVVQTITQEAKTGVEIAKKWKAVGDGENA